MGHRFEYAGSNERKRWLAPYLHFYNITELTLRSAIIHPSVAWIGTTS